MPRPLTDTPDALDTAIAASVQTRCDKMLRRVRNQKIRMRIALGLSGCIALFALTAYLIGDYAAASFCALNACIVFAFTYIVGVAARKKAADELREMDRPA
jgi:energy-converting hydrogenase Eha subunit C